MNIRRDTHLQGAKILILGPLPINKQHFSQTFLDLEPNLIFLVDGGTRHKRILKSLCTRSLRPIVFSLGDGDSSSTPLDFLLPQHKDFSDLQFLVESLIRLRMPITHLLLLGFSRSKNESRIDHLLFNIGVVSRLCKRQKIPIQMDTGFLFFPPGKSSFYHKGIFSLISLTPNAVKISGNLEYKLPHWTKLGALDSRGLSNIGHGKITLECKKCLVVYTVV